MTVTSRFMVGLLLILMLAVIPMPFSLGIIRPPWALLFVLYVQFYLPKYFRVFWILLIGFALDVLSATTLGEHAFALLMTSWLAFAKSRRFVFFSTLQHMLLVGGLCLCYQLILVLIERLPGYAVSWASALLPVVSGIMLWPWVTYVGVRWMVIARK